MTAEPGNEMAAAAAGRGHLRASHADREQVIAMLKAAFVQGRLTKDELDARVGQPFAARTDADLAALTADLPAGLARARQSRQPAPPPAGSPATRRSYWARVCSFHQRCWRPLSSPAVGESSNCSCWSFPGFLSSGLSPGSRRSIHGRSALGVSYRRGPSSAATQSNAGRTAGGAMIWFFAVPAALSVPVTSLSMASSSASCGRCRSAGICEGLRTSM